MAFKTSPKEESPLFLSIFNASVIKKIKFRRLSRKWVVELVDQLFYLFDLQWTYRNKYLHFRARDGTKTVTKYEASMRQIDSKI